MRVVLQLYSVLALMAAQPAFAATHTPPHKPLRASRNEARSDRVLFVSNQHSPMSLTIYSFSIDGKRQQRLTFDNLVHMDPCLSPDGSYFSWVSTDRSVGMTNLWTCKLDGMVKRQLTHSHVGQFAIGPSWSQDGSQIAYSVLKIHNRKGSDSSIYILKRDGTGARKLCDGMLPAWSPSSNQILFSKLLPHHHNVPTLFTINATGSGLRMVAEQGTMPSWSHDGTKIAFIAPGAGGAPPSVYLMSANGKSVRQITHNTDEMDLGPRWAPQGDELFFTRAPIGLSDDRPLELYVTDVMNGATALISRGGCINYAGAGLALYYLSRHERPGDSE